MAEFLITRLKPLIGQSHPIDEIVLLPAGKGQFEVTIDGELVYSKLTTRIHTTNEHILEQVRLRL